MAKTSILKQHQITRTQYNKKRKVATTYKIGDLVAIKRTQFGTGLKLRPNFFGYLPRYRSTSQRTIPSAKNWVERRSTKYNYGSLYDKTLDTVNIDRLTVTGNDYFKTI